MAGVVVGAAAGAILPFAITATIGVGVATDAFFLVYGAAIFFGGSASATAEATALPFLAEARLAGGDSVRAFLNGTARRAALAQAALVLVSASGALAAAQVLLPTLPQIPVLVAIMSGLPVLMAISGVLAAGHFIFGRFGTPSYLLAIRSGAALIAVGAFHGTRDLRPVAAALVVGELGRAVALKVLLRRSVAALPRGSEETAPQTIWRVALPHALSQYLLAASPLIDRLVAASIGIGAVTIVELAEKVYYAPALLLNSVVANVSSASWSTKAAHGDYESLRQSFRRTAAIGGIAAAAVAVAAASFLWLVRVPLAVVVGLQNPNLFPAIATIYVAGLPFALIHALAMRVLVVLRSTRVLVMISGPMVVLNVIGDLVLARLYGVYGIAVTTTVIAAISAITYSWHLRRVFARL